MNLIVGGKNIEFFNDFDFTLTYNSLASTFNFKANFDPNNSDHRLLFKPLSFPEIKLYHNGKLLITGIIINIGNGISKTKGLSSFSGYSLPGELEDCTFGIDDYPLEFNNLTLEEITKKAIAPFGLKLIIDDAAKTDSQIAYPEVTASESQSIKAFLSDLAIERGLFLTHNEFGNVVITKPDVTRTPVNTYTEQHGVTEITSDVNGQSMHSKIYVQQQAPEDETANASESELANPLVTRYRPSVRTQTSGDDNNTSKFNRSVIGAELRSILFTVNVYQWEWVKDGNLEMILPNNVILIQSPNNHLFQKRKFFIESVTYKGNQKEQTASLSCVPVECYSEDSNLNSLNGFFDD